MSLDAVREILSAEDRADEIRRRAAEAAKAIIADAEAEAARTLDRCITESETEAAAILRKAQEDISPDCQKAEQQADEYCRFLSDTADKNMNKAIDYVARKVVGDL